MLRFVVLTHDHPVWHWDFMLENSGALRTWRLDAEPASGHSIAAMPLPLHRLEYLDYEGAVSGGRGEVHRWDRGVYTALHEADGNLVVQLSGDLLYGIAELRRQDAGMLFQFTATELR
jgi:hypothetical protein